MNTQVDGVTFNFKAYGIIKITGQRAVYGQEGQMPQILATLFFNTFHGQSGSLIQLFFVKGSFNARLVKVKVLILIPNPQLDE